VVAKPLWVGLAGGDDNVTECDDRNYFSSLFSSYKWDYLYRHTYITFLTGMNRILRIKNLNPVYPVYPCMFILYYFLLAGFVNN